MPVFSDPAEDEYAPADTSPGECKKPTHPVSFTDRSDIEMRSEQLPLRSRRRLKELLTACTHNASSAEFSLEIGFPSISLGVACSKWSKKNKKRKTSGDHQRPKRGVPDIDFVDFLSSKMAECKWSAL